MIPNEHYESDVKYVLEQSHVVLRILGIWPSTDRSPSRIERIANIFLVIVCYVFLHCDMVPGVLYYIFVDDTASEKAKMVAPIIYSIMAIAKYGSLIVHERDIQNCLRYIKEDWAMMLIDDAREMMMIKATTARRLFVLSCIFMYGGGISYNTIVPIVSWGNVITEENITIRPLSCPGYYVFFDPQNSPAYEIMFILQFLCGITMYTITVTICGLATLFVMHACAQMDILIRLLEDLVDDSTVGQKDMDAKLAIIVEHQIRIRNFLRLVENVLCYGSLVEIVGCTTIICFVGYCIIEEWENQKMTALCIYIVALVSIIINIFILCFIGEYIMNQAEEVSLTFCALNWYRLPTYMVRNIILMTAASNVPPQITAGKFIDLSFKTFGDVIKSAVIYLNMLRQFTE